jgi:predicted SnoaL-like aldol condensation-catalyzing enzyme
MTTGPANTTGGQTMSDAAANKALVLKAVTELFGDGDVSALDRYYTDNFIQHNPQVADGTDGLRALVSSASGLHYQTGLATADGDIVMVHGRYEGLAPKPVVGVDIFRVENNRITEHWDVLQEEVTPTASGHPMFTGQGKG